VPDIVFLDIHLQGRNRIGYIAGILTLDPEGYVIMISTESSPLQMRKRYRKAPRIYTIPFSQGDVMDASKMPSLSYEDIYGATAHIPPKPLKQLSPAEYERCNVKMPPPIRSILATLVDQENYHAR